jgi:deazaflavin-dependent oxidoreductase (nitroreductase family)
MTPKDAFYKVGTGIHRAIFNISKGRIFGKALGMPLIELVTIGRRSGKEHATMLSVPIVDGDRLVVVASFGGDDRHPAWYLNLRANPEVRATMAGSTRTMIARIATEEERAELWPQITSVFEGYARYQKRTKRLIPVVILEPPGSHTSAGHSWSSPRRIRSARGRAALPPLPCRRKPRST